MKKTIAILSMMVAGVALAESTYPEAITLTTTFTKSGNTYTAQTLSSVDESAVTTTFSCTTESATTPFRSPTAEVTPTDLVKVIPALNIGSSKDANNSWTITLANGVSGLDQTATTLTLSKVDVTVGICNGSNGPQQADDKARIADFTLTLKDSSNKVIATSELNDQTLNNTSATLLSFTMEDAAVNVTAGAAKYTLELKAASDDTNDYGFYVGPAKLVTNGVLTPEPATATLSLLALAGLAARRRHH